MRDTPNVIKRHVEGLKAEPAHQFEEIHDKTYSEEEHLENSEYESKSRRKLNQ